MITEEQARAQGADDIDIFLGICNEEIIPSSKPSRLEQLHGKIVGTRTEPYHDVTVYEDGYEDCFHGTLCCGDNAFSLSNDNFIRWYYRHKNWSKNGKLIEDF